jgi:hypothetical protein
VNLCETADQSGKKQMGYVETIIKKTFHMVSKTPEVKKDHV